MDSSSTHSPTVETSIRKLRTFLDELMESGADIPAICRLIAETRLGLMEQWKADHPHEKDNPFTQEKVASRVGITLGAYGAFERGKTEPSLLRLREIALALGLERDYFSPTGDLASAAARFAAEADRFQRIGNSLETLVEQFQALLPDGPPAPAPDEHD
jgi:transcriptional regulator with XRE-family HTH domain